MEAWLRAVAASVPGPLRPAAWVLIGAIIRVWQWSDGLARRLRTGWVHVMSGSWHLARGVIRFAAETLNTVKWLVLVRIPQMGASAVASAVRWAVARLAELRAWAAAQVANLRRWAADLIGRALALLDGLRRWAVQRLAQAGDAIRRLLGHVFGVLGSPTRLAAWITAAMWGALWRYAWSNLDRYAEALWRRRRALLLRGAAEVERLLGRLL